MTGAFAFGRRRKRGAFILLTLLAVFLVSFYRGARIDEGTRRHVIKRFAELLRMPGRLLT